MTDPGLRLTERRNPRTQDIDTASPLELVDRIAAEDALVPGVVHGAREAIAAAIALIETSFRAGGRLIYIGAGTSGRLGVLDAAECPPTFGTPPDRIVGVMAGGRDSVFLAKEGAEDDPSTHYITSPFVGTFYEAPSPNAEAFVKVGSEIKPGKVLCIVEAMKLMNEIEADVAGTILEVLAENGKSVEYGDRLFKVKKKG